MKTGSEAALLAMLHSTRGGCSDTELNELTVTPTGWAWALSAVTMVTPVANWPSALRKSCEEKCGGWATAEWGNGEFTGSDHGKDGAIMG
ncbi:hypothetical protein D3C80_1839900 [compost metagenome]